MPSSQLKRAERAIQSIRDQAELPPETADALQELVDVIRNIEGRLSALENKAHPHPTEAMALKTGNESNQKKRPERSKVKRRGCLRRAAAVPRRVRSLT